VRGPVYGPTPVGDSSPIDEMSPAAAGDLLSHINNYY